jgi:hypothetical protein
MVWAFVVREAAEGPPFAEAIVEIDPALHALFVADVLDSGFTIAAGEPPETSAAVHVHGDRLTRLFLIGDRQVWEPARLVEVSPGWLSAAEARHGIVLIVVPPGTWPTGLVEMTPEVRDDIFRTCLAEARDAGLALCGTARLVRE